MILRPLRSREKYYNRKEWELSSTFGEAASTSKKTYYEINISRSTKGASLDSRVFATGRRLRKSNLTLVGLQ